jgi:hypothetical protein
MEHARMVERNAERAIARVRAPGKVGSQCTFPESAAFTCFARMLVVYHTLTQVGLRFRNPAGKDNDSRFLDIEPRIGALKRLMKQCSQKANIMPPKAVLLVASRMSSHLPQTSVLL